MSKLQESSAWGILEARGRDSGLGPELQKHFVEEEMLSGAVKGGWKELDGESRGKTFQQDKILPKKALVVPLGHTLCIS